MSFDVFYFSSVLNSFKNEYTNVTNKLKDKFSPEKIEYIYPTDPQKNGYDCGVYVCKTAEKIYKGEKAPFTFGDMNEWRKEIRKIIVNEIGIKKTSAKK